jgi:hypothetical protein
MGSHFSNFELILNALHQAILAHSTSHASTTTLEVHYAAQ